MEDQHPLELIDFSDVLQSHPEYEPYIEDQKREAKERNDPLLEPKPLFELRWTNRVIVDNLPEVTAEKEELLIKVLVKVISKAVVPIEPSAVYMPMVDGKSQCFAFVTFPDEELAKTAVVKCNGLAFDKKHSLTVVSFDEFDRLMDTPAEYVEPRVFTQKELKSWLTDYRSRDQFVIRHEESTKVFWNDSISLNPELVTAGPSDKVWTDKYVKWSTQGTYLATLHQRGIVLWGGPKFEEIMRLSHYGVSQIEFSPCERYLMTYSPGAAGQFIMWSLEKGEEIRTFQANDEPWGTYMYSYNGEFVAKKGNEMISVYNSETMAMIEDNDGKKAPIPIPQLAEFSWSSGDNVICLHIRESEAKPAQVRLLAIPSRELIATRMVYEALGFYSFWNNNGEFLISVVTTKHRNNPKPKNSIIEIFYVKKRGIPVESLSLDFVVSTFSWEPNRNRFALIYAGAHSSKTLVVYEVDSEKIETKKIDQCDTKCSAIAWAPQGGHLVTYSFAAKNNTEGRVEFFCVKNQTLYQIEERVHMNMNFLEWDPSGRYLSVGSLQGITQRATQQQGSGYLIFNCQGSDITHAALEKFYQFSWRLRPKSILDPKIYDKIENQLDELAAKYEEEDKQVKRAAREAQKEKEAKMKDEFFAQVNLYREKWANTHNERAQLLKRTDEEEKGRWIQKVEPVEEILSVKKEILT
ncbi:unnamed protein product [Blepharisma stoltei]|uniref:RRM domain-containing protein n=1 Tax=Blepharisma stoltei TaxID=1481888 RepID=A0AAU9JR06_9CILI|nr:unnamed protein product [Blepharisma stoltei]